ncbi:MAG: dUTP diphosphatase [Bacteroidia bacterium]|nr:dUTP diphosphatase [Bacteroidia bacterium]MDW8157254.1 dUTP diphosphatase [Bacteroidia bacterium]
MNDRQLSVKVVNRSKYGLPAKQTPGSSGYDLFADLETPLVLMQLERKLIPTGLYVEIPLGWEAQVRPRSGLAWEAGITVLNTPGTIDADYRGEVKVLLINLGKEPYTIKPGQRIAQLVFCPIVTSVLWETVQECSPTIRGTGGLGHTGE